MSKEERPKVEVICPCCQAKLMVDSQSGLVLHSERSKAKVSFDEAMEREKTRKEKSDELFQKAFSDEERRRSSLEDKFKAALDAKDELDEPPPRPWDLD